MSVLSPSLIKFSYTSSFLSKSSLQSLSCFSRNCVFRVRFLSLSTAMSESRFEYVRSYESDDSLLPNCWIVVRIDGRAFHKFSSRHNFAKPNDKRALDLMAESARRVLDDNTHLIFAYGQSDEFSFVLHRKSTVYSRRSSKIASTLVSFFTSCYVMNWSTFFPDQKLLYPPSFDARCVVYPSEDNLRDYLSWRQADCHINNLYNTAFWALVNKAGLTPDQATTRLSGTVSSDKHELLFSEFDTNYNNEPEQFKKGTCLYKKRISVPSGNDPQKLVMRVRVVKEHCDIIRDKFWLENSHILGEKCKENIEAKT